MKKRLPPLPQKEFAAFVRIVRRLRRECPWDRKQTHRSLRHSLLEESHEVIHALDDNNMEELKQELGDLLLHVILQGTIAEEAGEFTLADVLRTIRRKLVQRHPHVFGRERLKSAGEVKKNWEKLKMREGRVSVLDGIPRTLPSLQRALRMQQRASTVGFDWETQEHVWEKVREELEELKQAMSTGSRHAREEEYGDFLFALVNYARFLDVHPEDALRRTVEKFDRRFRYVERQLRKRGTTPHDASLAEMDALWNEAKRRRTLR